MIGINSFFSTFTKVSRYLPPVRSCFKQKKRDVLKNLYFRLTTEKSQLINDEVNKIVKLITAPSYKPHSNCTIEPLSFWMSNRVIAFINNTRFMISNNNDYTSKGFDLRLSPEDESVIRIKLRSYFSNKIDFAQQPYLDALNELGDSNVWHFCLLDNNELLLNAIRSFFESRGLIRS